MPRRKYFNKRFLPLFIVIGVLVLGAVFLSVLQVLYSNDQTKPTTVQPPVVDSARAGMPKNWKRLDAQATSASVRIAPMGNLQIITLDIPASLQGKISIANDQAAIPAFALTKYLTDTSCSNEWLDDGVYVGPQMRLYGYNADQTDALGKDNTTNLDDYYAAHKAANDNYFPFDISGTVYRFYPVSGIYVTTQYDTGDFAAQFGTGGKPKPGTTPCRDEYLPEVVADKAAFEAMAFSVH